MQKTINYIELGGTLFIPASHKNLDLIVNGNKYPELRSLVIDFEDGLDSDKLQEAMRDLENILQKRSNNSPYTFIRPRDTQHLKTLLKIAYIEKVDGFVLPKFSLTNAHLYFDLLAGGNFAVMPSIEGSELFEQQKLYSLKELLLTNKEKIVLVRFGLEDMLRQLGLRRACDDSVFDLAVGNSVLGNFIAIFKSAGFAISGGVYPCFDDERGFIEDVKRDLKEGLFSKTIIHPKQIKIINELYKVEKKEYDEAIEILESEQVVFEQNGKMAEKHTMSKYAAYIKARADIYG